MVDDLEERKEPKVEVAHEPDECSSSSGYQGRTHPASSKKWLFIPIILVGLVVLALGLWMVLPPGFIPTQKQSESPEFKALKEEVQKLKGESSPLKNEIQSLQEGQKGLEGQVKALQEQATAIKEQLTVLAKKPETHGVKKAAPKATTYKIKKGDTFNSIAQKFHVQPDDIRHWNRLSSKNKPQPGQTITIYSSIP